MVEGTRLLSGFSSKDGTGVRISPSPFAACSGVDYSDSRVKSRGYRIIADYER